MFEGCLEDMCAEQFPTMSMGGRAESLAFADPVWKTPISIGGDFTCNQKFARNTPMTSKIKGYPREKELVIQESPHNFNAVEVK